MAIHLPRFNLLHHNTLTNIHVIIRRLALTRICGCKKADNTKAHPNENMFIRWCIKYLFFLYSLPLKLFSIFLPMMILCILKDNSANTTKSKPHVNK